MAQALALAPEDPYVLARAGFYEQAAEQSRPGDAAWLAGLAGLGRTDLLDEHRDAIAALAPPDRRWIAGLAAAWSPEAALALLATEMTLERAACLLALDRAAEAEALLEPHPRSPERSLLLAAAAAARGDHEQARVRINAAFAAQHLPVPLRNPSAAPASLDELQPSGQPGMGRSPTVSVIVAARNAAATLPMAVRSLMRQSWEALEILVVDDGSADRTAVIAEGLGREDGRVRLLRNAGPAGASGARNAGLVAATGALVAFHDADDWAHPLRIQQQLEALEDNRAVAVVSRHFRLGADGRPVSPRVFPMLRTCPISVLARADAARRAGPLEESPVGADSEWLARLDLLYGRRNVARLDKIHVVAGWAPSSLSGAAATGLASDEGRALREAYERDWRLRHAERLRRGLP